ncbi:MAG: hypothetical protein WDM91_10095 [Rhizomicrobium sp.]
MIRQPLNIWRIYMDLLANFMGLVALGGAGLIMIGGAVIHASLGVATFPARCGRDPGMLAFARPTPERTSTVNVPNCQIDAQYPDIQYATAQTTIGTDNKGLVALCTDLKDLVQIARANRSSVLLEVVGHTSGEYSNFENCAMTAAPRAGRARSRKKSPFTAADLEGYYKVQSTLTPHAISQIEVNGFDRYICNALIAYERADNIVRQCSATAPSDEQDIQRFVTMAAEPHGARSGNAEFCSQASRAAKEHCRRTVTLRLRLLPPTKPTPKAQPSSAT